MAYRIYHRVKLDRENAAGNHIVLRLDGVDLKLLLAHLKNSSVFS